MRRAEIQRLRAELASDLAAFEARAVEMEQLGSMPAGSPAAWCALLAVALHHAYGAIEAALARIAKSFDGLPEGADWHQALPMAMRLDIETVRPAVLSRESEEPLRKLLAFRHFFRHAYAAPWDARQLSALRDSALAARGAVARDFSRFDVFLRDLAAALDD